MNPNQVPITLTLNLEQINTLLDGLAELPFKRVEALAVAIRNHAIERLKEAEKEALAANAPQIEEAPAAPQAATEVPVITQPSRAVRRAKRK